VVKTGSADTGQVARPAPDSVGALIPGEAENDNDDLRSLLRWVADQPERPNVEIVCAHETSPEPVPKDAILVRLNGCAAELSLASYLELAASGVAKLTVLASRCPMSERIETTVVTANQLLSDCPGMSVITLETRQQRRHGRAHAYDLRRLPVSRRRLLFLGLLDHSWVPDVHAGQRARAVAALCRLRADGSLPEAMGDFFAPAALLAATACSACGVCVRACPTGALRLNQSENDPGAFALTSAWSWCTDCGRCVEFCPSGVLIRTGQVDWARLIDEEPATVAVCSVQRCGRCGGNFAGLKASQYCPPCQFRIEYPFGSRQPCPSLIVERAVTGLQPATIAS
jgi:ferredoxin